jgi:hypothetical protein
MPLDTTIPSQAQAMQLNPLQALAQVNQIRQAKLQRMALQQQIGANQAASGAIQGNTDAQGNVNVPSVLAQLAQNPQAAYNLPDIATKLYNMQGAQYSAQNAKLEGVQKQIGYWDSQLGGMLAKGPNLSKDDVIKSLAGGISSGMISPQQAQQYATEVPDDPAQLQSWAKNHWLSLQDTKQQAALLVPQVQTVNTGGQTNVLNIDPLTGQPKIAGTLLNTMSPETATSPVQLSTPGGTPYITTRQQFANQAAGAGQPGAGYTGRYGDTGAGAGAQSDVPAGGLQTGLSPAQQAAQTAAASTQATQSTTAAQSLHNAAADAPMRVNLLNTARDALSGITTGPGTDWRNTIASALNSTPAVGQALAAMGVTDPSSIKNYDEYKKILTNYASSVSGSLGTGTDARLNAAVTGNANPGISNLANEDILVKTLAAEKMRAAQDYAFQNSGLTGDKFNQWQSQWNKNVNPDAFAYVEMNPAQQQSYIARQQKAGTLGKFKSDLGNLVRAGVIDLPKPDQPTAPDATSSSAISAAPLPASGVPR